jgi:predicted metal-dependent hydrolase
MDEGAVRNAITTAISRSMTTLEEKLTEVQEQAVNSMDPERILNIKREIITAERKRDAYLDPKKFDTERSAAKTTMYKKVLEVYKTTYDRYIAAGFKHDSAVNKASAVADLLKESLQGAIDAEFEDGTTILNQKQLAKKAELDLAKDTTTWDS